MLRTQDSKTHLAPRLKTLRLKTLAPGRTSCAELTPREIPREIPRVKIIGIVVDDKIVEQIILPRNPQLAVKAVNCVVQLELYTELDCDVAPFVG